MHLIKSLLIGALTVVAAVAQTTSDGIAFTGTPSSITPGQSVNITWGGGDPSQPVTLTLREGDYRNTQFVRVITGTARGNSYIWTVPRDLPNRQDYSLQIQQGIDDNNYSGSFPLTGSTASSSSSTSGSSSATPTSSSNTGGATGGVVQSVITDNTTTTIAASNVTTTVPAGGAVGTGAVGTGASGSAATGTAMNRNTTMSRPTLSSTSSSAETTSSEAATTSGGSETTGASGGGSTGAPSSGAMEVASFASPFALVLSAVAAIMFLG
ncbi:MAG: hypothetical protein L6R40_005974 [Gallowayella cf. fulva]|nr:MAG: hypothetical protein L6R40_005974 [Xanthomendoza cf. fulva]